MKGFFFNKCDRLTYRQIDKVIHRGAPRPFYFEQFKKNILTINTQSFISIAKVISCVK